MCLGGSVGRATGLKARDCGFEFRLSYLFSMKIEKSVWVGIPPEQPFLYENRKDNTQVRFLGLTLKSKLHMGESGKF